MHLTLNLGVSVKCMACNGHCYSQRNVRVCTWCEEQVHVKCLKGDLGCISCCEKNIPGYHAYYYELFDSFNNKNDHIHNPYSSKHFTMQIGNEFDNENISNTMWNDVSELLVSCKYKQPKYVKPLSYNELSILSLNIQTLTNKVDNMRENIDFYQKFDVLLFQETNTIVDKLPHGMSDLLLDGFHEPLVQKPIRTTGKGGGLVIYVNENVCEFEDIDLEFNHNPEPENTCGEFQFIKIKNCKVQNKTTIIGNVYRSPSRSPEAFNSLYETILQKLHRHSKNKLMYILGDFNQDLIKYDSDSNSQNLVDTAASHGLVQIVSRPTRITDKSATLIDHVYTNNLDSTLSCNIFTMDLTDHLATHTKVSLRSNSENLQRKTQLKDKINKEFRVFNEGNDVKFRELINNETWDVVTEDMDAQTQYTTFHSHYIKHYNAAYPLRSQSTRRKYERKNPKPWILPWLEIACARKNNLYHEFVKES